MTEHKFTDDEIIRDLQNASEWFKEHGKNTNTAIIGICERAVDLINRQKEEIEVIKETTAEIRYEAVKEFAERLKEEACYFGRAVAMEDIDNIAKELTGGGVCETNTTTEK